MQAWNYHLRQAHLLCPGDAVILILPQLFDREVTADAAKAFLMDDASQFRSLIFAQAGEPGVGIPHGRAELDRLESGGSKLLQGAWEVFGDHCSYRPGLTSDGHAKGIGTECAAVRR